MVLTLRKLWASLYNNFGKLFRAVQHELITVPKLTGKCSEIFTACRRVHSGHNVFQGLKD